MLTHVPDLPDEYWTASWGDLHDLRSKVTKGLQHILDIVEKEKRNINDDENQAYQYGMEYLEALDEEFEIRADRNTKEPVDLSNGHKFHGHRIDGTFDGTRFVPDTLKAGTGKEYRSLFYSENPHISLQTDGFNSMAEFFQSVAGRQKDSRLREVPAETRTNVVGTGISGGFLVPEAFTEMLLDSALLADEIFRPRALVLPMSGPSVAAPYFDTEDRTGGDLFGLTLEFYGENDTMDVQTAKVRMMTLNAKKGAILWEESRELIQDAPAFGQRLAVMLPRVIAAGLDKVFYTGNGIGRPLGLLNADSTITITRNTGSSILYVDIKKLWGALHPQCHRNAIWIVNSASIPQLLGLKDDNNNSIWHPGMNGSVKDGVPQTLFGRPVLYCEAAPAVGTSGDISLCDLSNYVIGTRQDLSIESSNAPGWTRDVVSFKLTLRTDGHAMWSKALTMEDGSELSWAAVLS